MHVWARRHLFDFVAWHTLNFSLHDEGEAEEGEEGRRKESKK